MDDLNNRVGLLEKRADEAGADRQKMAKELGKKLTNLESNNGGRVARGECTAAEMGAFLDSQEAQSVFASLRALNFTGAIAKIEAMTEPLATDAFKTYWVNKVSAENY